MSFYRSSCSERGQFTSTGSFSIVLPAVVVDVVLVPNGQGQG